MTVKQAQGKPTSLAPFFSISQQTSAARLVWGGIAA
jgi:hypothetical protein